MRALKWLSKSPVVLTFLGFVALFVALKYVPDGPHFSKPLALLVTIVHGVLWPVLVFVATRYKKHRTLFHVIAVSLVVTLVALEIRARKQFPAPSTLGLVFLHSPYTQHRHPASVRMRVNTQSQRVTSLATLNEDGLRTAYTKESFRKFGRRVAMIGDSFTFGLFVNDGESNPDVLEARLRTKLGTEDLAVLNAGVTSYSPFVERRHYARTVAAYEPQLVVLLLDGTDIGDDHAYGRLAAKIDPQGLTFGPDEAILKNDVGLARYSALYQSLEPFSGFPRALVFSPFAVSTEPPLALEQAEVEPGKPERNHWFIFRYPLDKTRPFFDATMGYVREIAADVKAHGAEFMLVVAPRYQHWNDKEAPNNWELREYALHEPYQDEYLRYFEERRGKEAFPVELITDALRASTEFPLCFDDDPHWNATGHRVVGEALTPLVADALSSPKKP